MSEPKKIYFDHSLDGRMKSVFMGRKFSSNDSVYVSVEHLKAWIKFNTHRWNMSGVDIIKPEELLKYINEP